MDELITQYTPTYMSQVRFQDRGYISERARAHRLGLIKGHTYIVHFAKRYPFHTELYLLGYGDEPFNRKMFDDVPETEESR